MATEFSQILTDIKQLLQPYHPPLAVKKDSSGCYELWTVKPLEVMGRKYPELFFASVALQKNFVGFYYFPIYTHPELKNELHPDLLKKLKGKSCFHIKKTDAETYKQIKDALKLGLAHYKKLGWV